MIEGDGLEYELLELSAKKIAESNVKGLTCEIGVRLGLGSCVIMNTVQIDEERRVNNQHIAIDPYGLIPYYDDILGNHDGGYSNSMRRDAASSLYKVAYEKKWNLSFFFFESTEFFKRFSDGLPVYDDRSGEKRIIDSYSLVHFDGQHRKEDVILEFEFFKNKMSRGGIMVFDDIATYDHGAVETDYILKDEKFSIFLKGTRKAAYIVK